MGFRRQGSEVGKGTPLRQAANQEAQKAQEEVKS
jgi:hypothetical protein